MQNWLLDNSSADLKQQRNIEAVDDKLRSIIISAHRNCLSEFTRELIIDRDSISDFRLPINF